MSASYHMEQKTSKQVLPITCNMEKMVFAVTATYEGLWVVSFQTEYKNFSWTLVCASLLARSKEVNLFFYM